MGVSDIEPILQLNKKMCIIYFMYIIHVKIMFLTFLNEKTANMPF